ncbi:MAG: hypothetical protein LBS69_12050, partial [Prevotellaceae bacterium]|nr:hypothetical protein [Prevotellaceae bacterium]
MKQIILSAIALLLCFSLCRAQTTSKDINIQKQQLSLSDLITLTKSKSLESARTFMSAKGWRKLPFEIDRKDDNGKTDYKGKLPVGFLRDDLEFFEHLPHDYKKLIWGVAYAEKSHNGSVYEYSETYCYVYFSATETSAVAFGNPITNKAYSESLLKQLANAGFKATQGGDYRNDTYELRINRGNQYFFYNHREFEANKVKRKATADRQGQEQWEKIQEKIKDETLSDLLPHAYALRKQGVFPHESLLDLDVLAYFSEDIPEDKINSELKIANFKKSEEYAAKLNSMRKWRQEVFS